jgi:MerR family redox-sensitive transcriptional activator SoxR
MAEGLTISAVARRAGLRPSAIRYYESVGLLPIPARVAGRRRYGDDVLPLLALIAIAQQMGFTIAEIKTLLHGFSPQTPVPARWRTLVAQKLPEVEAHIARAQGMKLLLEEAMECDCLTMEACARAWQERDQTFRSPT